MTGGRDVYSAQCSGAPEPKLNAELPADANAIGEPGKACSECRCVMNVYMVAVLGGDTKRHPSQSCRSSRNL